MIDANTQALNKYLDEQSKQELVLESFESSIEYDIEIIKEKINELQKLAKDYGGYDFTDELNIILGDLI